ncbi:MAG: ethanolamine utilization microcompartment protein EutL [Deltaproteobacteria bacterium]|nr:ethanolamine utilization microcompartment protein EutL [Deltaproteobacteria bacterium]
MRALVPQRPRLLTCRQLEHIDPQLAASLGLDPKRHTSAAFVTCDQDDSMYAALDHSTKFADVDVVYAKSFYAGSGNASGPTSGEILGVIAGPDPDEVSEGLWALRQGLEKSICFYAFEGIPQPTFFPHVISHAGRYLAPLAGVSPGDPIAYLIATPTEAMIGVDAALKRSRVRLAKLFAPPTETNFAGGYLVGDLADVEAAATAFVEAIHEVLTAPMAGMVRPARERR